MNIRECLQQAHDLIVDPAHWTTGQYALDASGRAVHYANDYAVAWCGAGAILRVINKNRLSYDLSEPVRAACRHLYGGNVELLSVNDDLGHTAVLAAFDAAIAAEPQS